MILHNNIAQQQHQHVMTNMQKSTTQRKKSTQKIEITSNERLPPIKAFNASHFMATPTTTKPTATSMIASMSHTNKNMTDNLYDNEQKTNNKKSQQQQQQPQQHPQSNITTTIHNDKLSNAQQQKQKMHQQNAAYGNLNVNNTQKQQQQQQHQATAKPTTNYTDYPHQRHFVSKPHDNVQTNYVQPQTSPTSLPAHKNDIVSSSFEAHNKNTTYAHTEPHPQQQQQPQQQQPITPAVSPKNKHKNLTAECFQNPSVYQPAKTNSENNAQDIPKPNIVNHTIPATKTNNEYLPQQPSQQQQSAPVTSTGNYGKLNTETLPAYTQYASQQEQPTQQQQQQHQSAAAAAAKMRLFLPQYGMPAAHTHTHYGNALPPPVTIAAPPVTPTPTVASAAPPQTMLPSAYPKGVPNYTQYYESMYDCGANMTNLEYGAPPPTHPPPPATAGFADYPAYSHHAPYHTNFPTNAYGCASLSTPVRAAPYMHWSPLVTSASLAEHHAAANSMFSTANYANNDAAAAQANQWHHQ